MRVIQIIPAMAEESSGPSYTVRRLNDSLRESGCGSEIAALDWPGSPRDAPAVSYFAMDFGPPRLGMSRAMRRWIEGGCRRGSIDLLHNHGMWQMNSLYAANSGSRHAVPVVQSPRGALSSWALGQGSRAKRIFWPLFQRRALERASCFHATAQSEVEDIRRAGFRQPVALIPNGIDLPTLPTAVAPARGRTVLFLGRLHPVKGIPALLESWRLVQDRFPDWDLKIAGSDVGYHGSSGHRAEVEALAARLGCERTTFLGEVNGAAKWRLLSEASLFILPSLSENFGVAVAEALASGTPAIVTHGAPWEGLDREGAGWWIGHGMDSISAALSVAMSLRIDELAAMGAAGRSWMVRDFSWQSIGTRMHATYRWLLEGGTNPEWVSQ
jgi:glycosyltransferase involved in cell wall biosynthesis